MKNTRIFKVEVKAEVNYGDGYTTINESGKFVAKNAREAIDIAEAVLLDTASFENDFGKMITPKYRNIDTLNVLLLAESSVF